MTKTQKIVYFYLTIPNALNQWDRVKGYTKDGNLVPCNNLTGNCIRPFAMSRKNWMFAGTPKGAEASVILYSLIETVIANGIEPYSYLRYILRNYRERRLFKTTRLCRHGMHNRLVR